MYAELTPAARTRVIAPHFRGHLRRCGHARRRRPSSAPASRPRGRRRGDRPISMRTHAVRPLTASWLPLSDGKVAWAPNLVYPGPRRRRALAGAPGRRRGRRSSPPTARRCRGAGLGAQRRTGGARPSSARSAPRAGAQAEELDTRGFPPGTLDRDLRARAGLQRPARRQARRPAARGTAAEDAERRPRARPSEPVRGKAVRTSIDPTLQESAVAALGAATAGSRCSTRRRARCWRSPGSPTRRPSRPGSTFKIITATGALDAGIVKLVRQIPGRVGSNSEIGREIPNATTSSAAAPSPRASPSRATRCSRRSAPELGGDEARRDRGALRVQLRRRPSTTPGDRGVVDPPQSTIPKDLSDERRGRRVGDRPGRGPGDPAGDGERRADDRQRGVRLADADRPRPGPAPGRRSRSPRRRPRRRCVS